MNFYDIYLADQYCSREFLKKNSVVIDAGANSGLFSLYASNIAKDGKVYAFEPAAQTYELLKQITKSRENIIAIKSGLGDSNVIAKIGICKNRPVENSIEGTYYFNSKRTRFDGFEPVSIIKLDDFVAQNNIHKIDFIKIDVEGYEQKVISGAKDTIRNNLPIISVSAYHHHDDKKEIPKLVNSIAPGKYDHFISTRAEEDIVFYPKNVRK